MRVRFAVVAALLVPVLWIGSSPASAYVRNGTPSLVSVLCSAVNDAVLVVWNKYADEPSFVNITVYVPGQLGSVLAIPGSRGSKGNWIITAAEIFPSLTSLAPGDTATVVLYDKTRTLESNIVSDTCE